MHFLLQVGAISKKSSTFYLLTNTRSVSIFSYFDGLTFIVYDKNFDIGFSLIEVLNFGFSIFLYLVLTGLGDAKVS